MDRKRLFIMIIVVGIAMIFVAKNLGLKKPDPTLGPGADPAKPPVVVVKKVKVVTAKNVLQPGAKLTSSMVELKDVPEDLVLGEALKEVKDVGQYEVVEAIAAGDPLLKKKLKEVEKIKGLSWVIPQGMRAMTIEVDKISGVGGFIQQGDRVDVIGIFTKDTSSSLEPVRTVLSAVEVLSIGQEMLAGEDTSPAPGATPPPGPPGKPGEAAVNKITAKVVPYVTIAVKPEEAEILTLVREKARFSLLLRSRKDDTLSTDEVELIKQRETLSKMEALAISKAAGQNPLGLQGMRNAPGMVPGLMPGQMGTPGLSSVRPSSIPKRPSAPKEKVDKKPREYKVETRKGTQDPKTVTVRD